jgi:hypothetical protein
MATNERFIDEAARSERPGQGSSPLGLDRIQESPLAHQGSGGPGDDRQDNSPGSNLPVSGGDRRQAPSGTATDPSAGDAPESEDPGANKSESDPE